MNLTRCLVILLVLIGLFSLLGVEWSYGDALRDWLAAHPAGVGAYGLLALVRLPKVWADETCNTDVPLYRPRHAGQAEAVYLLDHTPRHAGVSA